MVKQIQVRTTCLAERQVAMAEQPFRLHQVRQMAQVILQIAQPVQRVITHLIQAQHQLPQLHPQHHLKSKKNRDAI